MSGRVTQGLIAAGVALLGAAALFTAHPPARAAGGSFALTPASQTVNESASSVTVEVMLNDASGVSSWEFRLSYDPDILDLDTATSDPSFMSSLSGQYCPGAIKDETAGWVQLGCVTSQRNSGASGSGRVATVKFTPRDAGKSNLLFTRADLSNDIAESLPVGVGTGVIKVAGSGDSNSVEPTPTVNPTLLTPTASGGTLPTPIDPNDPNVGPETPRAATATPRSGVSSSGSSSPGGGSVSGATASSGAGAGAGSVQGTSTGDADGAPVAGYGSLEEDHASWPLYAYAALALVGVVCIGGGYALSRRQRAHVQHRGRQGSD